MKLNTWNFMSYSRTKLQGLDICFIIWHFTRTHVHGRDNSTAILVQKPFHKELCRHKCVCVPIKHFYGNPLKVLNNHMRICDLEVCESMKLFADYDPFIPTGYFWLGCTKIPVKRFFYWHKFKMAATYTYQNMKVIIFPLTAIFQLA